ncbi:hypothetical protein NDU88_006349 [Pleurodeles waltl]|uniref:Reverse transcriptase domain-containing protein n=1 Tax=Pleurodeles waltl TaxID=8319 RepID=A0AAV7TYB2_PLEWA|nr:hypothetical protein NDU88_006349 [Pleurodeles waltl]
MLCGIASAAAVFQRPMHHVLKGVSQVTYFQDDILVFGKDVVEHNEALRRVLCGLMIKKEKCKVRNIMAQQYMDDDQYGEYDAGHYDQHMEERLVEALDFHEQDSVNKALVKALRPFAQPIFNFGVRRFGAGSVNEPGRSSDDLQKQTVNTVLSDHEYRAFRNRTTPSVQTSQHSSDSDSADSDVFPVQDKHQGKCKCKAHHAEDSVMPATGKN